MKKFNVTRGFARLATIGSGLMLLQAPGGCALDEALVGDLTNLLVQTLVSSFLTGGIPIL